MNAAATPDSAAAADRLTCHVSDPLISGAQRRRTQRTRTDGRRTVAQEKWGRRRIRSRTLDGWTDGMPSARGCRSRWVGQSLSSFFRSVSISRCIRYSVIIGCFSASSESLRNMNYSWSKGFKITLSALLPQLECRSL